MQDKIIPVVPTCSLIKILGKLVQWFMSLDRTYKQTNRDNYFIYIDIGPQWETW